MLFWMREDPLNTERDKPDMCSNSIMVIFCSHLTKRHILGSKSAQACDFVFI